MVFVNAEAAVLADCIATTIAVVLVVHYHRASDTLPIGTLRNILRGTRWTEADLERLSLILFDHVRNTPHIQ